MPFLHTEANYSIKANIGLAIANTASQSAHKIAIEDEASGSITYGELHLQALALARQLVNDGSIRCEEPIGILTRHGVENIIAQVAVVYAGGSCLPLDPKLSEEEIRMRLDVAGSRILVVDRMHSQGSFSIDKIFIVDGPDATKQVNEPEDLPRPLPPDFRSHIFFTSGTTGTPKAVELLARGIFTFARDKLWGANCGGLRFVHINSTSFDAAIMDIWVPLINGATIVVVDRQEILNPEILVRSLKERRASCMFLTAAVFHIIASAYPHAFSDFEILLVGGESPYIEAHKSVLVNGPPKRLVHVYGPTECTVLAVTYDITMPTLDKGYIPIGKPLEKTSAYVLDDELRPVVGQKPGELFLGGEGVSRGYLCDQKKTEEAFIKVPNLDPHGECITLYRTKDIVYTDEGGCLVWIGRKDREIKLRGYRVSLDTIETELLLTGSVKDIVAMKVRPPGSNGALLVACVVYKDAATRSNEVLLAAARARLPGYMVPHLVAFKDLPVNRNGKLDRKKAEANLMELFHRRQNKATLSREEKFDDNVASTQRKLKEIWSDLIPSVPVGDIRSTSDFFALGATSLDVASLIARVRDTFGVPLPTRVIFENPTLSKLGAFLEDSKPQSFNDHVDELKAVLLSDATNLGRKFPIPVHRPVDWRSADQGNVFITGATGFVGVHLLVQLLQQVEVKTVRCLVRDKTVEIARRRLFANLAKYRLEDLSEELKLKIEIVLGDFAQPRMGLSESHFHELANWTSVIYHLGAQVNYNQPYSTHRAANVLGTLHVLQLAAIGNPKAVHYSSSIAAFGPTGLLGKTMDAIREDDPLIPYLDSTIPYETGYGQSQWVVEEIVSDLMRRGFPIAIYRLGFVLCNAADGVGNPDDFIGRLIWDCLKLGFYPFLPNQRKELLPVNYAASAMRQISMSNDNLGRSYHLTPDSGRSIDMNDLFHYAGQLCGVQMTGLPYQSWLEVLKRASSEGTELRLQPLIPVLEEKVYGERTRWELHEGMARFRADNTTSALKEIHGQDGFKAPVIDKATLKLYLHTLGITAQL